MRHRSTDNWTRQANRCILIVAFIVLLSTPFVAENSAAVFDFVQQGVTRTADETLRQLMSSTPLHRS